MLLKYRNTNTNSERRLVGAVLLAAKCHYKYILEPEDQILLVNSTEKVTLTTNKAHKFH